MKELILKVITESKTPITRFNVLQKARYRYLDLTDREMRRLVVELITDGHLIQSSAKGYSIIKTPHDMSEAVGYMKAKAKAISTRGNMLVKNWNKANPNTQYELFN